LGFSAVGFARAEPPLAQDFERYERFVSAGMHGEMGYLADHEGVRQRVASPSILADAKTVICVATDYARGERESADPPLAKGIARYARGRDYHGFLRKRVRRLADFVRRMSAQGQPLVRARAFCDTAPLLERAWAARSGLGFIGKNGMLIVPGQGSLCLLGEVVTSLELPAEAYGSAMADRCGSCRACLDACPTDAFQAPYVLDPRRCLAYMTIESRSLPPQELRTSFGDHLFGCDDCQTACPYNALADGGPLAQFEPLDRWGNLELADLVALDDEGWAALSQSTPLRRATRLGLARNALLVAAGRARRGDEAGRRALRVGLRHHDASIRGLAEELLGHCP
jgi:epoxyqueuosine reductase